MEGKGGTRVALVDSFAACDLLNVREQIDELMFMLVVGHCKGPGLRIGVRIDMACDRNQLEIVCKQSNEYLQG